MDIIACLLTCKDLPSEVAHDVLMFYTFLVQFKIMIDLNLFILLPDELTNIKLKYTTTCRNFAKFFKLFGQELVYFVVTMFEFVGVCVNSFWN